MTHIVHISGVGVGRPTKKMLRDALKLYPTQVLFEDPSIFPGAWSGRADQMKVGQSLTCTNHPKRSWFASVVRTEHGFKVE